MGGRSPARSAIPVWNGAVVGLRIRSLLAEVYRAFGSGMCHNQPTKRAYSLWIRSDRCLFATDQWFAAADNLINPSEPVWKEGVFSRNSFPCKTPFPSEPGSVLVCGVATDLALDSMPCVQMDIVVSPTKPPFDFFGGTERSLDVTVTSLR